MEEEEVGGEGVERAAPVTSTEPALGLTHEAIEGRRFCHFRWHLSARVPCGEGGAGSGGNQTTLATSCEQTGSLGL